MKAVLPHNEEARLEALRQYDILDTEPEEAFDGLVRLAAQIAGTTIAVINFIDRDRQWFKAKVGIDLFEAPRQVGLSHLCLKSQEIVVISDAQADPRYSSAIIAGYPPIRFYAGVPLVSPTGHTIGTVCVSDPAPRHLTAEQIDALQTIGRQVMYQLELRRNLAIQGAPLNGITLDSTERGRAKDKRKRAEAALRQSEQAALLDVATDAIFVQDLQHRILFWNKGSERMYGWRAQEVIGQTTIALLHVDSPAYLEDILQTVVAEGDWQGELQQVSQQGRSITIESRWTLMRDEAGRPKSILVVNTDSTEKKQLEAQFLRAQRMESLGTLAGGIAHDLNNVLTPILSSAQLLLMHPTLHNDKKQQLLRTVESSARRGADLVKQVLSFARGVEGKHTVLQIRHLITEIQSIARETFPKSIELQSTLTDDLWMVSGDATQLHQVLMNLCVNAYDAMPNGGNLSFTAMNLRIDDAFARMHLDARVGPYVVITVSDTGIGISPDVLDRIFEPFFTTKELGKGTGLGLSTVLSIVKSHGGFIDVSSALGQGTQFKIYLPAVQAQEPETAEQTELLLGAGELILVVDDEAPVCQTTQASLESYNYQVLTAHDGIEAIALYAQHKSAIALVLVDIMMPSMDGPMTIRTLRKMNSQVKIIAVSGLACSTQLPETVHSGIQMFLSKPYTTAELLNTVRQVLKPA